MNKLRNWMYMEENKASIPKEQFKIVSAELKWNMIGIKGGNMFTITYSILWNVSIYPSFWSILNSYEFSWTVWHLSIKFNFRLSQPY